jgi:chromosome segregation ATPase
MSRIRVLAHLIAFSLSLFLNAIAFQPGALAQTETLDPAKISEFQSKLESGKRTQADLNQRVICLNQRDAQLVSQRAAQETLLGQLRSQEQQLDKTSRTQQSAYDGYVSNFQKEQSDLNGLRTRLRQLESRKRAQELELQDCKARWYVPNFACDASNSLLHLVGEFRSYEGAIAAAAKREQIARESANLAYRKLEQSKREVDSTRGRVNALAAEISRTEREIGALKTALSDLRAEVQPYQIVIDEFANALTEAKDINLADARARTARKLATIAANLDAAMARSTAAIGHANSVLPAGSMGACIAR